MDITANKATMSDLEENTLMFIVLEIMVIGQILIQQQRNLKVILVSYLREIHN